ncbi:hypothetical protein MB14_07470 [Roseivirga ehrenbergii]|uniref:Uncharacterized protein n=1 Tax=Roseivirga ehrenbergii (strain DSM 102268 / JCM 13514 / KCTC 12282 / NCIMB 14502 / KMM 6017) TaxID=279360 RepID=A0A150X8H5_ROSEK|nr:hypothetical protein MB14_07470 [Roseivirga ehrenbergii]
MKTIRTIFLTIFLLGLSVIILFLNIEALKYKPWGIRIWLFWIYWMVIIGVLIIQNIRKFNYFQANPKAKFTHYLTISNSLILFIAIVGSTFGQFFNLSYYLTPELSLSGLSLPIFIGAPIYIVNMIWKKNLMSTSENYRKNQLDRKVKYSTRKVRNPFKKKELE